jgi:uncharacterized protein with PQ loop repeat
MEILPSTIISSSPQSSQSSPSSPSTQSSLSNEIDKQEKPVLKYNKIALAASIISILAFLPQLIKIGKTKDVTSFSKAWLYMGMISGVLWVIFGIKNKIYANALAGAFFALSYAFILFISQYYSEKVISKV